MTSTDLALSVRGLQKTYKGGFRREPVEALKGIDLDVARGEVFGLLGPNGAGKTTLIKLLLGIVQPTGGTALVLGEPIPSTIAREHIGYLPEGHRFPPYLTGLQTVEMMCAIYGMNKAFRQKAANEALDECGLIEVDRHRKIRTYSKGMQQRLGLAQAIATKPDLIFLDEPTDGVDPVGRHEIRNHLLRLKEQGTTLFVSSHLLSEIEQICDRVAILDKGHVIHSGVLKDLLSSTESHVFHTTRRDDEILTLLKNTCGSEVGIEPTEEGYTLYGLSPESLDTVIDAIRSADVGIRGIIPHRTSLEERFITVLEEARQDSQSADNEDVT